MTKPYEQANVVHRALRRFGSSSAGTRFFASSAGRLDAVTSRLTGGRTTLSKLLTGIDTIELTTTGARSGQARTVRLLALPHADGLALLASNFGRPSDPAWFRNLVARPFATAVVGRERWDVVARVAGPEERERIWAQGLAVSPHWRAYEDRAGRVIQAVVLERRPGGR